MAGVVDGWKTKSMADQDSGVKETALAVGGALHLCY